MPLVIRLRAETHSSDWQDYQYGLRGRIMKALEGTEWTGHIECGSPPPFSFSELYPFSHELYEGDEKYLLLDAIDDDILRTIAERLQRRPTIFCGAVEFDVRAVAHVPAAIGSPGESGTLVATSGILLYVGERDGERTFWGRQNDDDDAASFETFREHFRKSARSLCEREYVAAPAADAPLVDRFELLKEFSFPMTVAPEQRMTVVASKWRLAYDLRDETHAEQLRLLARHGIGAKTAYGLGALAVAPAPTASPMETVDWYVREALDDSFLDAEEAVVG